MTGRALLAVAGVIVAADDVRAFAGVTIGVL